MNTDFRNPSNEDINKSHLEKANIASVESQKKMRNETIRNLVGFWLLGLTNNYAYVIMLSAAHDILSYDFQNGHQSYEDSKDICNPISTGLILILDVVPSLVVKAVAPFIGGFINSKMWLNVIFQAASFLLTGMSVNKTMAYVGVVCASLASGLGETTLLGYMSKFDSNMVSTWSSGTGAAGFFGALSYMALTAVGITPRNTILIMLIVPVIMWISYFSILAPPTDLTNPLLENDTMQSTTSIKTNQLSIRQKLNLIKTLYKFMLPIGLVYLFEYFINQGLFELVFFKTGPFDKAAQYRFYQTDYQFGVLLSRSSVNLFRINRLWILSLLQGFNVILLLAHIINPFLPSFWVMALVVLFEGLLGGWSYVNTYTKIKTSDKIPDNQKEFSMSVTSVADTFGIAVAGALAIPVHNILCAYMKRHY